MAIKVSQEFERTSANPIDKSLTLTKAQMLAVNDNLMPDKYFTICKDDGQPYLYDKSNSVDPTTGKYRLFEGGSSVTIDPTPTQGSTNAVQSGGTYTALDGKVDKENGKGLSTNDYTDAEKTKLAGINLSNYIPTSQKGVTNGVATLGENGKVPMSQIPNGLDETIFGFYNSTDGQFYEDAQYTELITPQAGLFYYDEASTNFYRWTGSAYVSFTDGSTGLVIGEVTGTAYDGGKGKENRDAITAIKDGTNIDSFGDVESALLDKVDKITGKGLSTNDYTDAEKTKVTNAQTKTLETAKTIEGASVTTVQGVADAVQTHTDKSVTDANGVHGFKVTTSGGETKIYYKSGNSWVEIELEDSIQISSLPTAGQDNVGKVLQYIGNTTSVDPIYKHGYFYECVEDGGNYSWQNIPLMDVQEIQKVVLPTASADELGNIYQYVGSTTQTYKKGFFYECTRNGASYEWISVRVQAGGGQTIQYDIMPTASGENEDDIIQYIGETTASYTNGFFYKCVAQGTDPETYAWENVDVQAGGGGDDSRIEEEIMKIGILLDDGLRPYITVDATNVIPPFSTATLNDIAVIADLYYSGALSLADIKKVWNIGDSKAIPVSAMLAEYVGETHDAQDVTMYIADFAHDDLTTAINGKTKALLTFSFTLSENGQMNTNGADASGTSHGNEGGWKESARRSWCNDTCYEALPSGLRSAIKSVDRTTDKGSCSQESNVTSDKLFLPSSKDLTGIVARPSGFTNAYSVGIDSGVQYEMYKTDYPLDKEVYTTTTMGGQKNWAYAYYSSYWTGILADFSGDYIRGDYSKGLFIHGCI